MTCSSPSANRRYLELDYSRLEIRRGNIVSDVHDSDTKDYFKRYAVTETGVSPRTLPGTKNGIHHVTGVEHAEDGKPSESPVNRIKQMEKRMRKIEALKIEQPVVESGGHDEADVLVIGFISTHGAIEEAMTRTDLKVNHMQIRQLHPFPTEEVQAALDKAKKVIVAENNYRGQLAQIIKMNTLHHNKITSFVKYDGTPFLPHDIEEKINTVVDEGVEK